MMMVPGLCLTRPAGRGSAEISRKLGRSFSLLYWQREWRVGLVMGLAWGKLEGGREEGGRDKSTAPCRLRMSDAQLVGDEMVARIHVTLGQLA